MAGTAITKTAAFALGAFLALHQPASAGLTATLETTTAGGTSWTYTATASEPTYTFGAVQGTDWLGSSQNPMADAPAPGSATLSMPEPATLALLGFPLLFVAGFLHLCRRRGARGVRVR